MPVPQAEARRATQLWRLGRASGPVQGRPGDRLGHGTGSSLEFQDRRAYVVGDDIRRLDWRAMARTDQPMVRLYREELEPRVRVLVDASRSMAVDEHKAQLAVDLAYFFAALAAHEGSALELVLLGDEPLPLPLEAFEARGVEPAGNVPLEESLRRADAVLPNRRGLTVFVVSDFLSPFDAQLLVRPLAGRAASLSLLQVLGEADVEPPVGSALRLVDSETAETRDLVLDPGAVAAYRERFARHTGALATECRRARGELVTLVASSAAHEAPLAPHFDALARSGLIEPA